MLHTVRTTFQMNCRRSMRMQDNIPRIIHLSFSMTSYSCQQGGEFRDFFILHTFYPSKVNNFQSFRLGFIHSLMTYISTSLSTQSLFFSIYVTLKLNTYRLHHRMTKIRNEISLSEQSLPRIHPRQTPHTHERHSMGHSVRIRQASRQDGCG